MQAGNQHHPGEAGRGVHAQRAARRVVVARERLLGFLHVRENAHAAFVIGGAVRGHADAPCGPVQQLDAEMGLQVLDQAGERGFGQVKGLRRARKTADIHHPSECLHRDKTIHDVASERGETGGYVPKDGVWRELGSRMSSACPGFAAGGPPVAAGAGMGGGLGARWRARFPNRACTEGPE
ncbi:hypothetical protein D3C81_1640320 [compost metagenome]